MLSASFSCVFNFDFQLKTITKESFFRGLLSVTIFIFLRKETRYFYSPLLYFALVSESELWLNWCFSVFARQYGRFNDGLCIKSSVFIVCESVEHLLGEFEASPFGKMVDGKLICKAK